MAESASSHPDRLTRTLGSVQVLCLEAGEFPFAVLLDGTNGIPVLVDPFRLGDLAPGDVLDVTLVRNPHDDETLRAFRKTGHAPLPAPVPTDLGQLARHPYRPVAVRGIVRDVLRDETNHAWNWLTLRTASGDLPVAAQDRQFPLERLRTMTDAEVALCGYVRPMCTWRRGLGLCLCLVDGYEQTIMAAPSASPDAAPVFDGKTLPHRQRLAGTVIARTHGRFFLRAHRPHSVNGNNDFYCEVYPSAPATNAVAVGDLVTIVGFFEPSVEDYVVTEAVVRVDGTDRLTDDKPQKIGFDDLFPDIRGNEVVSTRFCRRRVRIVGTVRGRTDGPKGRRMLILGEGSHSLQVDVSSFSPDAVSAIRTGSRLAATGLCLADFVPRVACMHSLEFSAFTILPAQTDDLEVLARPPGMNPRLLLSIIGGLLTVLVGIVFWNRSLARLSERRGLMLYREQLARTKARLKVDERTRLAVELHDALSQNLTGVALQLDAVRRFADDREKTAHHLALATLTLKSCRNELRNCLWDLRNHALEERDVNTAIRRTVSPFVGEARLTIRFNVAREKLSDDTAHALMRITRELATNAVRHGHASAIRIAGTLEKGLLHFSVSDNGGGFDPTRRGDVTDGHFGLEGIRERISRLDGKMEIDSSPDKGTTVTISLVA